MAHCYESGLATRVSTHPDDKVDFYLYLWEPVGKVGQRLGEEGGVRSSYVLDLTRAKQLRAGLNAEKEKEGREQHARAGEEIQGERVGGEHEIETGCYSQRGSFTATPITTHRR